VIPTLHTKRLNLRPLTKATQRHVDWLRDPRVVQYSEQRHSSHTLNTVLRYIQSFQPPRAIWGISEVDADRYIGNITAAVSKPNQTADMGIMIGDPGAWGFGFATEAWKEIAEWLLDKEGGGLRKLEAGCMKVNTRMIRVFDKTGFNFEAERPAHFMIGGSPVGAVYYSRYR
jgi:[ribosomal protein S5]-alanine N-acetyltransferase